MFAQHTFKHLKGILLVLTLLVMLALGGANAIPAWATTSTENALAA